MQDLLFALNSTMPIFFTMAAGMLFRRIGWIDESFASQMNRFVFRVVLPVNLFVNLYPVDFFAVWDTRFVLYCFLATAASIGVALFIARLVIPRKLRGEFVQASYRSSASLLGMAFIQNMYANGAMGGLMILASVPLYNVAAVLLLTLLRPSEENAPQRSASGSFLQALRGIVTNPLIIGIFLGMVWSLLRIPMPEIGAKTLKSISAMTSPMGLMAMGASLDPRKVRGHIAPSLLASAMKLVVFVVLFTPIAALLGFRNEKLVACLVMLGSATTVSGYVMARSMGHEGILSQTVVVITTLLSAFTITLFLWVLRGMGMV